MTQIRARLRILDNANDPVVVASYAQKRLAATVAPQRVCAEGGQRELPASTLIGRINQRGLVLELHPPALHASSEYRLLECPCFSPLTYRKRHRAVHAESEPMDLITHTPFSARPHITGRRLDAHPQLNEDFSQEQAEYRDEVVELLRLVRDLPPIPEVEGRFCNSLVEDDNRLPQRVRVSEFEHHVGVVVGYVGHDHIGGTDCLHDLSRDATGQPYRVRSTARDSNLVARPDNRLPDTVELQPKRHKDEDSAAHVNRGRRG